MDTEILKHHYRLSSEAAPLNNSPNKTGFYFNGQGQKFDLFLFRHHLQNCDVIMGLYLRHVSASVGSVCGFGGN